MFQPLSSLLGNVLRKKVVGDGVRAAVVIEATRDIIETLFPQQMLEGMTPLSFRDGTVVIAVRTPLAGQELRMRSTAILRGLEERFKSNLVKRISIVFRYPRQGDEAMLP